MTTISAGAGKSEDHKTKHAEDEWNRKQGEEENVGAGGFDFDF